MRASVSPVFFILVLIVSSVWVKGQEDKDAALKQVFGQCLEKHRISNEAVESIANHENVPDDYEVKCWLSCVMKKLEMIKEGKINWEHCKALTKQDLSSEEDKAKVDKIVEICQAEVSQDESDECQLAFSAAVCKIKNWKELGLPTRSTKQ